ncbi:MAG: hypothetical protein LUI07_04700 [Lachnospiraceae bacterium]|nr:hypothetical protein [Lachnospiraceae bacterium]
MDRNKKNKEEKNAPYPLEDDGHTIADMSGIERSGMFGHFPKRRRDEGAAGTPDLKNESGTGRKTEQPPFTRKERRIYTFAALRAGLLIGLVYIVGCCAVIGLLYLAWVVF